MLEQAILAFQNGNFDGADLMLKRVLQVDSKNLPALHVLGLIKASQANFTEAADLLSRAARINPNDASIQYNLAKALSDSGLHNESIRHHKKAVELAPNNPEAWLNYGKTASNLGRDEEALVWYDKAISLKPDYAEALLNKGATLKELRRYEEAIAYADTALSLNPNLAEAWSNKGVALKELKRYDEAVAHYDKALSLKPDYAEAWSNKGVALKELKRYDEAVAHFDKALILKPDYSEVWSNKGAALTELHRYEEAIAHYDKALSLKSDIDWLYGDLIALKMKLGSWNNFQEMKKYIFDKVRSHQKIIQPFALLPFSDDAFLHKQASEIYVQDKFPMNAALGPIAKRSKKEKIRLGYFSPDFRNHPVGLLTSELFELHHRSQFEVFAFSLQEGSDNDDVRLRLRKGFDRFIDVENMSDLEIAKLTRELEIDVAIDLSGFTQDSRTGIFAYRAAPIQVNYLGYPGTMGANYMDYIVADSTIIPEENRQFYTEKLVYLPHTYMVDDSKRVASSRVFSKQEFDLPEGVFIFCCFNNHYKFNGQVLDSWSRILLSANNSVLWISENNEQFKANIQAEFEKRGVDSSRVVFAKKVELMGDHLARYALADLFLDTHPNNAHTTAVDSLKAGVPVITRLGGSFANRVAASLLNAIGLPEMVTTTQEEYEALAIELANNPPKMVGIKEKLAKNRLTMPLFDTPLFTTHLEGAYTQMMERYWADLPPENLYI